MVEFDPSIWAEEEAARLRELARQPDFGPAHDGGFQFEPSAAEAQSVAASAVEFLRRFAGSDSELYRAARDAREIGTAREYLSRLAGLLDQFVRGRDTGFLGALPFEVASRVEAATDLMEQVARLLGERDLHVAAPVALAGAALEEFLRSLWHQAGTPKFAGVPSINKYATALQSANVIDRGEVKDITAWADLRNRAAHGDFDSLDLPRAHLMADGINLFMQRRTPRS